METYRLNSKLVEEDKTYLIKTVSDIDAGVVCSEIFIDGVLANSLKFPHPEKLEPEEVLSLVESTHGQKKKELEILLEAYRKSLVDKKPRMCYHLGLAFLFKRFFNEAKILLQKTIELNPKFSDAYKFLSLAQLTMGHNKAAVKTGAKATEMKPKYPDYRNCYGEALMADGKYEEAACQFEKACELNMYYSEAYFNLGLTLILNAVSHSYEGLEDGYIPKAKDCFNKASLIDPEYVCDDFEIGLRALENNELSSALELLNKVKTFRTEQKWEKSAPLYMRFIIHPDWITEDTVKERIDYLQSELKKNPSYVDHYAELSGCYLNHSILLWRKGVENYQKMLDLRPNLSQAKKYKTEADNALKVLEHVMNVVTGKE